MLNGRPDRNLLKNPGFSGQPRYATYYMGWNVWHGPGKHEGQKIELDKSCFITAGQSLHLVNTKGNIFGVTQRVKNLKPGTRYRLSFYIRTKDVEAKRESLFSGLYVNRKRNVHLPSTSISGTQEWTRMAFEFTTPEGENFNPQAPFGISFRSAGEVWFDNMRLEEIAP